MRSDAKFGACTATSTPSCTAAYDQYLINGTTAQGCNYAPPDGWSGPWTISGFTGQCGYLHYASSPSTADSQAAGAAATPQQLATYIGNLPAADPNSVESNTVPVGSQVAPTPADATASNPVPSTGLATTVVPAPSVQPTDTVVNPNATPPTGTETTKTQSQPTTGTTTTTTTNPDGSVTTSQTKTDSDTAAVSCAAGNHEQRTFGSILQEHMILWAGSGLLSALNLLKTLTWPTAIPTYSLQSTLLGTFTLDFSAWSGMLTAIRSIVDRGVRGVQDRLCGGSMTALLTLIYCFLMDMIASFKDLWLVGWDSLLAPVDALLASVGTGGLAVPVIADQYAWLLGATGMSQAIALIAGAMGVRFLLQSVPFVRWGS